jgi:hypothetical protein
VSDLLAFARERHAIYLRRQAGKPWPWTQDPILQEYRFCNVYRELDTVTGWIREHWREPRSTDPDLWFAMVVARFVNWPPTLDKLGCPVPWDVLHWGRAMRDLVKKGQKVYSGAYMLRADPDKPGVPKYVYQARAMFDPMWKNRKRLRPTAQDTLCSYHMLLGQWHGMGSFMSAQVVADLKYVEPLRSARDWHTFAASGPGSRRGLNRVMGRPVSAPWREDEWRLELGRLQEEFNERWVRLGVDHPPLHAQDVQNVLCEYSKYIKTKLGEGRPRARYQHEVSMQA